VLTPVADGVAVHRSELLQNQTVVVQGRSRVLVVTQGSPLERFDGAQLREPRPGDLHFTSFDRSRFATVACGRTRPRAT
jgi:hypothetical protein